MIAPVVPFPTIRSGRTLQEAHVTRVADVQLSERPSRAVIRQRMIERLEGLDTYQLQIIELVIAAIARGAV